MTNEAERAERAIQFAEIAYQEFCDMRDRWPSLDERMMFIGSMSQAYLDSRCADCGHSPTGRLYDDESKDYSI